MKSDIADIFSKMCPDSSGGPIMPYARKLPGKPLIPKRLEKKISSHVKEDAAEGDPSIRLRILYPGSPGGRLQSEFSNPHDDQTRARISSTNFPTIIPKDNFIKAHHRRADPYMTVAGDKPSKENGSSGAPSFGS